MLATAFRSLATNQPSDALEQVRRLCYVGDALPFLRVDFGPVMLGKLLGGAATAVPGCLLPYLAYLQ